MRVVFRTDASMQIGTGHLMRCLALAAELREQAAECLFVCREHAGHLLAHVRSSGFEAYALPKPAATASYESDLAHASWLGVDWSIDAQQTREVLADMRFDWLVVDHYSLDHRWESVLRFSCKRIMVIDDLADRRHDCDLLLDQNYYLDLNQRYQDLLPDKCLSLLGPSFVLFRREFYLAKHGLRVRDGIVRHILVFFGGNDSTNQTEKALKALGRLQLKDVSIDVVVGSTNANRESIRELCDRQQDITYHCNISNMAELVAKADLGIGAGGTAMWERCFLGLPTITVVLAENQFRTTEDVARAGATEFLGWSDSLETEDYSHAILNLILDRQRLKQMSDSALDLMKLTLEASAVDVILNYNRYSDHGEDHGSTP